MGSERLDVGEAIERFEDLVVYQTGYALVIEVYQIAKQLPEQERRELGYQLRRAAVSIPANIAEGYGRKNSALEFKHFLRNALGSSNEVIVLLRLVHDLYQIDTVQLAGQYTVLGKQLYRLIENWK